MITTTVSFAPITKRSRCGKWGKHIMCPNCTSISKVSLTPMTEEWTVTIC